MRCDQAVNVISKSVRLPQGVTFAAHACLHEPKSAMILVILADHSFCHLSFFLAHRLLTLSGICFSFAVTHGPSATTAMFQTILPDQDLHCRSCISLILSFMAGLDGSAIDRLQARVLGAFVKHSDQLSPVDLAKRTFLRLLAKPIRWLCHCSNEGQDCLV